MLKFLLCFCFRRFVCCRLCCHNRGGCGRPCGNWIGLLLRLWALYLDYGICPGHQTIMKNWQLKQSRLIQIIGDRSGIRWYPCSSHGQVCRQHPEDIRRIHFNHFILHHLLLFLGRFESGAYFCSGSRHHHIRHNSLQHGITASREVGNTLTPTVKKSYGHSLQNYEICWKRIALIVGESFQTKYAKKNSLLIL